jgi:hypothetical protein
MLTASDTSLGQGSTLQSHALSTQFESHLVQPLRNTEAALSASHTMSLSLAWDMQRSQYHENGHWRVLYGSAEALRLIPCVDYQSVFLMAQALINVRES